MFGHQDAIIRESNNNNNNNNNKKFRGSNTIQTLFALVHFVISNICVDLTMFVLCVVKVADSFCLLDVCKFYVVHTVHFVNFIFLKTNEFH